MITCYTGIDKILILQKKAVRIMTNSCCDAHCRPLFVETKILTVVNQYIFSSLIRIKASHPKFNIHLHIHQYPTRYNYFIVKPAS